MTPLGGFDIIPKLSFLVKAVFVLFFIIFTASSSCVFCAPETTKYAPVPPLSCAIRTKAISVFFCFADAIAGHGIFL